MKLTELLDVLGGEVSFTVFEAVGDEPTDRKWFDSEIWPMLKSHELGDKKSPLEWTVNRIHAMDECEMEIYVELKEEP